MRALDGFGMLGSGIRILGANELVRIRNRASIVMIRIQWDDSSAFGARQKHLA